MMPVVELLRREENVQYGTFGILSVQKQVFCVTLEPPDRLNIKNRSSIPAQQYICERYSSAKYPDTFQIMDVPGRDKVLFHAGNDVDDTLGCVILAQYFGKLKGNRAILNSGQTFKDFMKLMTNHQKFHLTIVEHY